MKNIFAGKGVKNLLNQKGFTLVEMLVVVAIIAILASVFLVGLSGFRQSAYDARRLSDIQNVQTYLERFYNMNQTYPTVSTWSSKSGQDLSTTLNGTLQAAKILNNSQSLPVDPAGGTLQTPLYQYCSLNNGQSYVIGVPLSSDAAAWSQSAVPSGGCSSVPCFDGSTYTKGMTIPSGDLYCVVF